TVRVRRASGVPVSLAEPLSPEFHKRGESLFSPDRFHPNSDGYELAAGLLLPAVCTTLGVWDEPQEPEATGPEAQEAEAGARDADGCVSDVVPDDEDSTCDVPRGTVVMRLTRRLTKFVRAHEDADGTPEESALHIEDVDGDPESTGDAREAADTLRRRSRILRRDPSPRDPDDS